MFSNILCPSIPFKIKTLPKIIILLGIFSKLNWDWLFACEIEDKVEGSDFDRKDGDVESILLKLLPKEINETGVFAEEKEFELIELWIIGIIERAELSILPELFIF